MGLGGHWFAFKIVRFVCSRGLPSLQILYLYLEFLFVIDVSLYLIVPFEVVCVDRTVLKVRKLPHRDD